MPRTAEVTLATSPAGLLLKLDGQTVTTPHTFTGVAGIVRNIEAVSPQTTGGSTYQWSAWSDGGAASHDVATPAANATYTASFLIKPDDPGPLSSNPPPTGSAATIRLAPVPANDVLVITSPEALQGEVRIVDAKGVALAPVYQQQASHRIVLNVAGLKPGLYALTLRTRRGTVTRKASIFR